MHKMLLTAVATVSALAVAAPAAAQWGPAPAPVPYGNAYGNPYGQTNWGYTRSLQVRIDNSDRVRAECGGLGK